MSTRTRSYHEAVSFSRIRLDVCDEVDSTTSHDQPGIEDAYYDEDNYHVAPAVYPGSCHEAASFA